jgi:hypothetical protein
MQSVTNKIRPKSGFSNVVHIWLNLLLPVLLFILVRLGFAEVGLLLILLGKWRMFAVRPRYWLPNIRANGIDIIVGVSVLVFMTHTTSIPLQLVWGVVYALWLVLIKPGSNPLSVSLQAFLGQFAGLMAVFIWFSGAPLYQLIIVCWVVCYLAARHFFSIFEEPFTSLYAHTWGFFAACLIWILGHWLLFYGIFAQPTVILTVIGAGLASLYYLKQNEKLSRLLKRQIVSAMLAIIVVIVVFSQWNGKLF